MGYNVQHPGSCTLHTPCCFAHTILETPKIFLPMPLQMKHKRMWVTITQWGFAQEMGVISQNMPCMLHALCSLNPHHPSIQTLCIEIVYMMFT